MAIFRVKPGILADPPPALERGVCVELAPEQLDIVDELVGPEDIEVSVDTDLVKGLLRAGLEREWDNSPRDEYRLDRWLASRLHAAVRVPRRIASDRRFWAWLAMTYGAEYVHSRFQESGVVSAWRFTGELLRNALSRLWWAAELVRDGRSYKDVDRCLSRVRVAQFALELKYSWYRPAAIAFVRVATDATNRLGEDDLKALSTRANAYLPLAPLEAIGFDNSFDRPDWQWWLGKTTLADLCSDEPPVGPEDGQASTEAIDLLSAWYSEILTEVWGNTATPS